MPRIKTFKESLAEQDRSQLVSELAEEIQNVQTSASRQPLILEQELPQTGSIHVLVFWDKWASIPREHRGSIIIDAYETVDPEAASRILIAMGLTYAEGIEMNFLPYQIQTTIKNEDPVDPEKVKQALLEEGAVQTYRGLQLRLPTESLTKAAYERLVKKFPGSYFAIAKTVAPIED